jgi:hypothetical protein
MATLTKSTAALAWIEDLGWQIQHRHRIASGEFFAQAAGYRGVIPDGRPHDALLLKLISGELPVKDADRIVQEQVTWKQDQEGG